MNKLEKLIKEAANLKYTHLSANPPHTEIKERAAIRGFIEGALSNEAKEYWFNTFIDEIIENETFLDFASKCASKKYEVGSKEHTVATMSIKFGMGCSLTKEYWQQGLYTEEEVFNLAWQLWEGFLHETKECPDYHAWFEQNKKK